jgi:hypothetical protein
MPGPFELGLEISNQYAQGVAVIEGIQGNIGSEQFDVLGGRVDDFNGHPILYHRAVATQRQKRTFYNVSQFKVRERAGNHFPILRRQDWVTPSAARLTINNHLHQMGKRFPSPPFARWQTGISKLYAAPQSDANSLCRAHFRSPAAGCRGKSIHCGRTSPIHALIG